MKVIAGWDENSAHELTRYIVNKLDNNEKETLDEYISLDEISKVIKILKPNKSPGEDGIILEFYQLYWQDIKNEFFEVVEKKIQIRIYFKRITVQGGLDFIT
jgi:hypothetical protein